MFKEFFDNFGTVATSVLYAQNSVFSQIVEKWQPVLVFKTTNWCWNNCTHCCESSGAKNKKNFIPASVITGYLDQALKLPNTPKDVVFTGGEIMSGYKFVDPDYIPTILNHALNNGFGTDIKTNAGWVGTPVGEKIFTDIENLVKKRAPRKNLNLKRLLPFQVSLSLDRFHKDAIKRNTGFINHFATTNMDNATFIIHVSSFAQDRAMFQELLQSLADSGQKVSQISSFSKGNFTNKNPLFSVNDNIFIKYSEGTLFNHGRAKDIDWAIETPVPQFRFVTADKDVLVAFDSFGNVTLGENSGEKISVPWRATDGTARPLDDIYTDLIVAIKRAEQEYLKQHKLLNNSIKLIRKFSHK